MLLLIPAAASATRLAWDSSPDSRVVGYAVHVGQSSGVYNTRIDVGAQNTYAVTTLPPGSTNYFAVTAYDAGGVESAPSNEVVAVEPSVASFTASGAPVASFTASATSGPAPLSINFTNSSSGSITSHVWTFGDGTSSAAPNPAKAYVLPGVYTVSLTVTGPGGSNVRTETDYITVTPSAHGMAPGMPRNVGAVALSSSSVRVSWQPAADNVPVIAYALERCQGAACTSFTHVSAPTLTYHTDNGLVAGTTYRYRVRAYDAAGNASGDSAIVTVTTGAGGAIGFVQANYATPQASVATVQVPFKSAQSAGNLNVVVVGWNDLTSTVTSVTDSAGNVYARAVGPHGIGTGQIQAIYYAKNIKFAGAGANTVTVKFSVSPVYPDIRVVEYRGLDPVNPVDGTAAGSGTNAVASTPSVTTTTAKAVLFAATTVSTQVTGPGPGFASRVITAPEGNLVEDRVVGAIGTYNATAPMVSGGWVMHLVVFRAAP